MYVRVQYMYVLLLSYEDFSSNSEIQQLKKLVTLFLLIVTYVCMYSLTLNVYRNTIDSRYSRLYCYFLEDL